MPDRVIRATLLDSDAWLGLPEHAYRLAYLCCLLTADDAGNFRAGPGHLYRLWRDPTGLTADQMIACQAALGQADLVRWYVLGEKRYGHIPRFRQRIRHLRFAVPRPPAEIECNEIKAMLSLSQQSAASGGELQRSAASRAPAEVKGSEVKRSKSKAFGHSNENAQRVPVDNSTKPLINKEINDKPRSVPDTQIARARALARMLQVERDPLDDDNHFICRVQKALDAHSPGLIPPVLRPTPGAK